MEIRKKSEIHNIRSCFFGDDIAHIRRRCSYKATMTGLEFKKPFECCCFADLDNFTMTVEIDRKRYTLKNCIWDDFYAAADREKFREHISVIAMDMESEDI